MEVLINNRIQMRVIGISRDFSDCLNCKRRTITIVRIVNGKKQCTCMHCDGKKSDPNGELVRY